LSVLTKEDFVCLSKTTKHKFRMHQGYSGKQSNYCKNLAKIKFKIYRNLRNRLNRSKVCFRQSSRTSLE